MTKTPLRELFEPDDLIYLADSCLLDDPTAHKDTTVEIEPDLFFELCRLKLGDAAIPPPSNLPVTPRARVPMIEMPDFVLRNFLLIVKPRPYKVTGRPRYTEEKWDVLGRLAAADKPLVEAEADRMKDQDAAERERYRHSATGKPMRLSDARLKAAEKLKAEGKLRSPYAPTTLRRDVENTGRRKNKKS
jgi:hypothetical protein